MHKVLDSIGRRLLRKIRGAPEPAPPLVPPHVLHVNRDQLLAAVSDARTGGPTAVDRLSSLLIEADRGENPDLESLAVSLLAGADPALWKNLDLAARRTWGVSDWAKIARERISQGEPSTLALVVASFHPVGFVREAAVARLAEIDDKVVLPALALRTGDWVPQVRDRARAAVGRHVSSSVQSLLGVGPLAVLLADRIQGSWLFAQIKESITTLNDSELRQLLGGPDRTGACAASATPSRSAMTDLD